MASSPRPNHSPIIGPAELIVDEIGTQHVLAVTGDDQRLSVELSPSRSRPAKHSTELQATPDELLTAEAATTTAATTATDQSGLSQTRTWVLISIVAFTMVMSSGGHQGLNIAVPVIQKELHILESNLQWISSGYSLTWGCFLLLGGRIADVYGRKWSFIVGIGWYAIWSLVGSFMHSGAGLIVTRALAGIGAALGIPASMGLIAMHIHGKQRATAFAVFSAGAPMGGAVGMTMGGVLTSYTSSTWRAVLWVFTGLAAFISIAAVFAIPSDAKPRRPKGTPRPEADKIDWLGATMVTCGLVLVQFTVSDGMSAPHGWRTPYIPVLFVVGVFLIATFFFWEYHIIHRTTRAPLLRLALFTRARGRLAAIYFVGFILWMGFISIAYHATLYYQQVQGTGTVGAFLRALPGPVAGIICNVLIAKIVHSLSGQLLICTGLAATGLASTFMAVSSRSQNYWTFPFNAMWLQVVGADFFMPVASIFVSRMALPQEQSVAGALYQTLLQLGGSFGLTLTTVISVSMQERSAARGNDAITAMLDGQHAAFWLSAGLCFFGMLVAAATLHGIGIVSQVSSETMDKKKSEQSVESQSSAETEATTAAVPTAEGEKK